MVRALFTTVDRRRPSDTLAHIVQFSSTDNFLMNAMF